MGWLDDIVDMFTGADEKREKEEKARRAAAIRAQKLQASAKRQAEEAAWRAGAGTARFASPGLRTPGTGGPFQGFGLSTEDISSWLAFGSRTTLGGG